MKKQINFSKFLIFFKILGTLLMLQGCAKDNYLEDMLPNNGGTVTFVEGLNVGPQDTIVPAGTSVPIYVEGINTMGSIILNPDNLIGFNGLNGTYSTPVLNETTVYTFSVFGKNGKIYTKSVTVTIISKPVDPKMKDFTTGGWQIDSCYEENSSGVWVDQISTLPPDLISEIRYYHPNGGFDVTDENGVILGNGNWEFLSNDSLRAGGSYAKIEYLDSAKLVLTFMVPAASGPDIHAKVIYKKKP